MDDALEAAFARAEAAQARIAALLATGLENQAALAAQSETRRAEDDTRQRQAEDFMRASPLPLGSSCTEVDVGVLCFTTAPRVGRVGPLKRRRVGTVFRTKPCRVVEARLKRCIAPVSVAVFDRRFKRDCGWGNVWVPLNARMKSLLS